MTIDDKVRKSLADLGATDEAAVSSLFSELRGAIEKEKHDLIARVAANEAERQQLAKALRDRWLARKNGLISLVDENWLKAASKAIKPVVGRHFNELRQLSSGLELPELIGTIPVG